MKLTVKEYSTHFKVSVQSVYQRIKKGTLKSIEKNGVKYVITDDVSTKEVDNPIEQPLVKELVKDFNKVLKRKDKEIRRLTKALEKCKDSKSEVLLQYIQEMKQLQLAAPKPKPKKKKKKR